jgi:8-oxo-dGTP pyrophosphatase MutT (NUDIX family)
MTGAYSPDLDPRSGLPSPLGATGQGAEQPPPRLIDVAVAALWRRVGTGAGSVIEVLAARRHAHAIRGGCWELPGGKIEPGESAESAALREVAEETGIVAEGATPLGIVEHHDLAGEAAAAAATGPDLRGESRVRLHAVLIEAHATMEAKPLASAECRWIPIDAFDAYEWPPANARLNDMVRDALHRIARP